MQFYGIFVYTINWIYVKKPSMSNGFKIFIFPNWQFFVFLWMQRNASATLIKTKRNIAKNKPIEVTTSNDLYKVFLLISAEERSASQWVWKLVQQTEQWVWYENDKPVPYPRAPQAHTYFCAHVNWGRELPEIQQII